VPSFATRSGSCRSRNRRHHTAAATSRIPRFLAPIDTRRPVHTQTRARSRLHPAHALGEPNTSAPFASTAWRQSSNASSMLSQMPS
jgi:hypothetical protein